MKYEEPGMQVIVLIARDVFMSASTPEGTVTPGIGGGGVFEDDDDGKGDF